MIRKSCKIFPANDQRLTLVKMIRSNILLSFGNRYQKAVSHFRNQNRTKWNNRKKKQKFPRNWNKMDFSHSIIFVVWARRVELPSSVATNNIMNVTTIKVQHISDFDALCFVWIVNGWSFIFLSPSPSLPLFLFFGWDCETVSFSSLQQKIKLLCYYLLAA